MSDKKSQQNELHLFAGAGGGILGGMLLGHRCVCAVEIDPYCRDVLLQRQRDGVLPWFPIWDDVRTFDGRPWRGLVDIICGGFPCQDISCVGKRAGIHGPRSGLWKEFARVIGEVRPRRVFVENVAALLGRGMGIVCGDLARLGYDAQWGVVSAADAGAPHLRKRIWILADAVPAGERGKLGQAQTKDHAVPNTDGIGGRPGTARENGKEAGDCGDARSGTWWANSNSVKHGLQGKPFCGATPWTIDRPGDGNHPGWWEVEPDVGRVVDGVANRMDRLKALGNGQVPAVVRIAWNILEDLSK